MRLTHAFSRKWDNPKALRVLQALPLDETLTEGESLIVYDNDGAHYTFVRAADLKKTQPSVAEIGTIEANTALT